MTKQELIQALIDSPHDLDTPVFAYLNEEEGLEDIIGDIAFIESIDTSIDDRIDLNITYQSEYE